MAQLAVGPGSPSSSMVGTATVELVGALLSSVGVDDLSRNEAMRESQYARVVTYVQQHLTDPGLCPQQIARENFMSLRQLMVWSQCNLTLAGWIMAQRLESARRELVSVRGGRRTIGAIAHDWGFADSNPIQPQVPSELRDGTA